MFWNPLKDSILISLLHISMHDFRSRGLQSWTDIAATMTEQAPGYGIPLQVYTAEMVQVRWYELRPRYEQQVVEETARDIQANRERLVLPPLREECRTEPEPEMAALDRETGTFGPASTFEELCKDRKSKGSG
jgi:hypothetical protein